MFKRCSETKYGDTLAGWKIEQEHVVTKLEASTNIAPGKFLVKESKDCVGFLFRGLKCTQKSCSSLCPDFDLSEKFADKICYQD